MTTCLLSSSWHYIHTTQHNEAQGLHVDCDIGAIITRTLLLTLDENFHCLNYQQSTPLHTNVFRSN